MYDLKSKLLFIPLLVMPNSNFGHFVDSEKSHAEKLRRHPPVQSVGDPLSAI